MKKAFDTIDHELLLAKLEQYGFRGPIFHLIQNYLQNRNQYVFHQGKNSSLSTLTTGVPQGSILSPFLFFTVHQSRIAFIADDTFLYHFGPKANDEFATMLRQREAGSKQ